MILRSLYSRIGKCFAFDYDRNSSDPRLLLNMWRMASRSYYISDIYVCMYVHCDIPRKHALFCRSCVLSGHFKCNSQKQQTGFPMVFASD